MKNDDFKGLVDVAKKINGLINIHSLPTDPHELIKLEKEMEQEERLHQRAKRAREHIIRMRQEIKARKQYAREMRRMELQWKIHSVREKAGAIFNKLGNKN